MLDGLSANETPLPPPTDGMENSHWVQLYAAAVRSMSWAKTAKAKNVASHEHTYYQFTHWKHQRANVVKRIKQMQTANSSQHDRMERIRTSNSKVFLCVLQ